MWPSARSAWPTRDSEDSGYRGALQESSLLWANTIPRQTESQSNVVVIINSVRRLADRWRVCRAPGVIGRSCSNHNKAPSLGRLSSMALSSRVGGPSRISFSTCTLPRLPELPYIGNNLYTCPWRCKLGEQGFFSAWSQKLHWVPAAAAHVDSAQPGKQ